MRATEPVTYQDVVRVVREWPADTQLQLIQEVAMTLRTREVPVPEHRDTLSRARGLLSTARPAPSDAEVRHLLDEARTEKYG